MANLKDLIVNGSARILGTLYAEVSGNATTATTATKLGSTSIGGTTQPIYLDAGTPKTISYTIAKSVPADAKFTDTTYSNFVKSGSTAASGLVPAPPTTAGTSKYLREDGTWQTPPDNNTTYSNGTGITIGSGNAINHSNSVTAGTAGTSTATSGSTLAVPYVTYDAQGHITATGTHTHTVTGFSTTDTKNTAGSTDTNSKIFLVGATSQAANPQTYSHDTAFVDANGRLNSAAPASDANDTTVATTKWVKDRGYTSNTGTVTSVNNIAPVSGNVTLTIPAAQVNSDWNATSGVAQILNKPTITDTKDTAGATNSTSKLFLVGRTAQSTGTSNSNVSVYTQNGYLYATTPASTQNDTTVATTKFVKDQGYTSNVGTVTKVNNTSPDANGNVTISIPAAVTETTVSGWGFTKNTGTVKKVNNTSPDANGNVTISIPAAVTESTVSGWGFTKNTGTVKKVNNTSPDANGNVTLTIPTVPTNISSFNNDSGYVTASVQTLQPISVVTYAAAQTITLAANTSMYKLTPTGDITSMTFSLAASIGASTSKAYTFELYLDMSSALRTIAFPASSVLTWQEDAAPDLSEMGVYIFAFRTMDGGSHWIGNLQGKW